MPSITMAPTLGMGDTIEIDTGATPRPGDIVVFDESEAALRSECGAPVEEGQLCASVQEGRSEVSQVLRVAAGPGSEIAMPGGNLVVDGKRVEEPYDCNDPTVCDYAKPIVVPDDSYFLLADNRNGAIDSRTTGPVAADWIVGVRR